MQWDEQISCGQCLSVYPKLKTKPVYEENGFICGRVCDYCRMSNVETARRCQLKECMSRNRGTNLRTIPAKFYDLQDGQAKLDIIKLFGIQKDTKACCNTCYLRLSRAAQKAKISSALQTDYKNSYLEMTLESSNLDTEKEKSLCIKTTSSSGPCYIAGTEGPTNPEFRQKEGVLPLLSDKCLYQAKTNTETNSVYNKCNVDFKAEDEEETDVDSSYDGIYVSSQLPPKTRSRNIKKPSRYAEDISDFLLIDDEDNANKESINNIGDILTTQNLELEKRNIQKDIDIRPVPLESGVTKNQMEGDGKVNSSSVTTVDETSSIVLSTTAVSTVLTTDVLTSTTTITTSTTDEPRDKSPTNAKCNKCGGIKCVCGKAVTKRSRDVLVTTCSAKPRSSKRKCPVVGCKTPHDEISMVVLPAGYFSLSYPHRKTMNLKYGLRKSTKTCCTNCFPKIKQYIKLCCEIKGIISYTMCQDCEKIVPEHSTDKKSDANGSTSVVCFGCLRASSATTIDPSIGSNDGETGIVKQAENSFHISKVNNLSISPVTVDNSVFSAVFEKSKLTESNSIKLFNPISQDPSDGDNYNQAISEFAQTFSPVGKEITGELAQVNINQMSKRFNLCQISGCISLGSFVWLYSYADILKCCNEKVVESVTKTFQLGSNDENDCCRTCFSQLKWYAAFTSGCFKVVSKKTRNQQPALTTCVVTSIQAQLTNLTPQDCRPASPRYPVIEKVFSYTTNNAMQTASLQTKTAGTNLASATSVQQHTVYTLQIPPSTSPRFPALDKTMMESPIRNFQQNIPNTANQFITILTPHNHHLKNQNNLLAPANKILKAPTIPTVLPFVTKPQTHLNRTNVTSCPVPRCPSVSTPIRDCLKNDARMFSNCKHCGLPPVLKLDKVCQAGLVYFNKSRDQCTSKELKVPYKNLDECKLKRAVYREAKELFESFMKRLDRLTKYCGKEVLTDLLRSKDLQNGQQALNTNMLKDYGELYRTNRGNYQERLRVLSSVALYTTNEQIRHYFRRKSKKGEIISVGEDEIKRARDYAKTFGPGMPLPIIAAESKSYEEQGSHVPEGLKKTQQDQRSQADYLLQRTQIPNSNPESAPSVLSPAHRYNSEISGSHAVPLAAQLQTSSVAARIVDNQHNNHQSDLDTQKSKTNHMDIRNKLRGELGSSLPDYFLTIQSDYYDGAREKFLETHKMKLQHKLEKENKSKKDTEAYCSKSVSEIADIHGKVEDHDAVEERPVSPVFTKIETQPAQSISRIGQIVDYPIRTLPSLLKLPQCSSATNSRLLDISPSPSSLNQSLNHTGPLSNANSMYSSLYQMHTAGKPQNEFMSINVHDDYHSNQKGSEETLQPTNGNFYRPSGNFGLSQSIQIIDAKSLCPESGLEKTISSCSPYKQPSQYHMSATDQPLYTIGQSLIVPSSITTEKESIPRVLWSESVKRKYIDSDCVSSNICSKFRKATVNSFSISSSKDAFETNVVALAPMESNNPFFIQKVCSLAEQPGVTSRNPLVFVNYSEGGHDVTKPSPNMSTDLHRSKNKAVSTLDKSRGSSSSLTPFDSSLLRPIRKRRKFTQEERDALEAFYVESQLNGSKKRSTKEVQTLLPSLERKTIHTWFRNRRFKEKKDEFERKLKLVCVQNNDVTLTSENNAFSTVAKRREVIGEDDENIVDVEGSDDSSDLVMDI